MMYVERLWHRACDLAHEGGRPDDMCDDCYDLANRTTS